MAQENLAKKLRKLTQSSRKKVVKANLDFMNETLENILEEVKSYAEKGKKNTTYKIKEYGLTNPGDYSVKDMLDYFGNELCKNLKDNGFTARFEHGRYVARSDSGICDDCSPFGGDSYDPINYHYITLEIGW